jgi:hypothetical protein
MGSLLLGERHLTSPRVYIAAILFKLCHAIFDGLAPDAGDLLN